jgi:predicted regulator of Ras-like GTPase activity (Roadblock/LC7/MglB family)
MTQPYTSDAVGRMLDALVVGEAAVKGALVLSRDGILVAASSGIEQEDAEHLSALVVGVQRLARGACHRFNGGELLQSAIEMDEVLLFMVPAGEDMCLAVLSPADAGSAAYAMTELAERLGERPSAGPRLLDSGVR